MPRWVTLFALLALGSRVDAERPAPPRLVSSKEVPRAERSAAFARLSEAERRQLGSGKVVPRSDWPRLRNFLLSRSRAANSNLRPELTAFTPGETLALLNHPDIKRWHEEIVSYRIPKQYRTVAFVPCAKTKPWADATRGIYKSYNRLRKEFPDVYFVTVSEPLGIVPEAYWGTFPQYDNPGLFRDPVQRSGLFTADWKRLFGSSSRLETPFDEEAYEVVVDRLSQTIKRFIDGNRRSGLRMVSFVEDQDFRPGRKSVGTHSDMLTRAGVVAADDRFKKRGAPREEPYAYVRARLLELR